ncbi:MAG: PDZ domain-containing protein [Brooklawnia sp.]|uniref:YlbL family protein n=1 Tax=Brooklawnia sp. TaxID=2699740 RepID=UPI003C74DB20
MTKQGWTATVSTALFVVLIALVSLIPVPFVSWTPGKATNVLGAEDGEPVLQISGATTYPTEGELQLATVAVTRRESDMSLPQAFIAYLLPAQTVLPREVVYPIGRPATQQQANAVQQMVTSQREAVVAALVEAGIPVTPLPLVTQVSSSGPAYGKVEVGDLVTSVDGSVVSRRADVQAVLAQVVPGTVVRLGLVRANRQFEVSVTTVAAQDDPSVAKLGIELENSYQHSVQVEFGVDPEVVGPSGGLAFGLAVYEALTPGSLIDGRNVAATGVVSASGEVGGIGALRQKIRGAERAGAEIMLVPAGNCADAQGFKTSMTLVRVTTLRDAAASLELLKHPSTAEQVPRC